MGVKEKEGEKEREKGNNQYPEETGGMRTNEKNIIEKNSQIDNHIVTTSSTSDRTKKNVKKSVDSTRSLTAGTSKSLNTPTSFSPSSSSTKTDNETHEATHKNNEDPLSSLKPTTITTSPTTRTTVRPKQQSPNPKTRRTKKKRKEEEEEEKKKKKSVNIQVVTVDLKEPCRLIRILPVVPLLFMPQNNVKRKEKKKDLRS